MNTQISLLTGKATMPHDITAGRHKGNAESIAANPPKASKEATHRKILDLLAIRPRTSKELAEAMHTQINCISGRLSELKAMNKVVPTGDKRDGAAELRLV